MLEDLFRHFYITFSEIGISLGGTFLPFFRKGKKDPVDPVILSELSFLVQPGTGNGLICGGDDDAGG